MENHGFSIITQAKKMNKKEGFSATYSKIFRISDKHFNYSNPKFHVVHTVTEGG